VKALDIGWGVRWKRGNPTGTVEKIAELRRR
jgi:hypothetical protein